MDDGRRRTVLRAYDKATGQDAGAVSRCRRRPPAGPMTYIVDGVQYIAIGVGGNINGRVQAQFMTFRLPNTAGRK
jgi:hypothetical protein